MNENENTENLWCLQVSDLYQQYQKAARLQTYLAELEELLTITDKLQSGAQGVGEDFRLVNSAISSSLSINLKHDKWKQRDTYY